MMGTRSGWATPCIALALHVVVVGEEPDLMAPGGAVPARCRSWMAGGPPPSMS